MKIRIEIATICAEESASSVSPRRSRFAIGALGIALAVCVLGCGAAQAPPATGGPAEEAGPLVCTPSTPCPPLQQEIEAQCKGTATVQTGFVGGLTVLRVETDPKSYVFTSFSYFYDAAGQLVGRSTFVNEYSRHSREGTVPSGAPVGLTNACPAR